MKNKSNLTPKLRQNWWIDAMLGLSAVFAILSSLYFLAFPVGGYQGGRNPYYNIRVIFDRHTWDMPHTWTGVLMIMAALLHIIIHLPYRLLALQIAPGRSLPGSGNPFHLA